MAAGRHAAARLAQQCMRRLHDAATQMHTSHSILSPCASGRNSALQHLRHISASAHHCASNNAAMLHGINDLRFEQAPPLPESPPPGNVRVAIKAMGICRTDIHYLQKGHFGHFVVNEPMVIGHEAAGSVVEVGHGVQHLQVGDAVALEPGVPCCNNVYTREGRYNLDPDIRMFATPPNHGALAQFVDHPAAFSYKLPEGVGHEQGAMCEPLSVGVHAVRRAAIPPGADIAVIGSGPIGLVTTMAAKALGAGRVAVVDMNQANLEIAQRVGADVGILSDAGESPLAVGDRIKAALGPRGPAVVFDCVGFEATMQAAMRACRAGGRAVLVGMGSEVHALDMTHAQIHEIDIVASFRYVNTWPLCLELLQRGAVDVMPMITHRFGFSATGVADGFDCAARSAETKAVKVMFNLD